MIASASAMNSRKPALNWAFVMVLLLLLLRLGRPEATPPSRRTQRLHVSIVRGPRDAYSLRW